MTEPTVEMLTEMAYILRLYPRGEIVHVQFLKILKEQYLAAITVAAQNLIHYPDCWDTAAYPTLDEALIEIGKFECTNEECNHK